MPGPDTLAPEGFPDHSWASRPGAGPAPAWFRPECSLRVLQILASPGWGGLEKTVVEVANELAGRCDVEVAVPATAEYVHRFSEAVGAVHTLPEGSRRNPVTIRKLSRLVRDVRPDIVHAHAARAAELVWWAGFPGLGGIGPAVLVGTKHNTRRRRIFDRLPYVTGVSRSVADTISNPRGTTVVYNGVTPRPVPVQTEPEVFTLVAVGRLDRYKGFDALLEAAARLPFPFRLRIAGEGGGRDGLESMIHDLDLEDRVELLGHRNDVPELLAGAHAQVVPSRSEGFSLALVEGLHYARLVVSTPVGIAPEVLPEELLLDLDDLESGLRRLHADYERLVELFRQTAAAHHDRFTWRAAADEYLRVFEGALAARPERTDGAR